MSIEVPVGAGKQVNDGRPCGRPFGTLEDRRWTLNRYT